MCILYLINLNFIAHMAEAYISNNAFIYPKIFKQH